MTADKPFYSAPFPTPGMARIGAALALAVCAQAVFAQSLDRLPQRKAGLWETVMDLPSGAGGTMTMQQCVDDKTDEAVQRRQFGGDPSSRCTTSNVRTGSGGYEADYACDSERGKMSGHVKVTGDMSSGYTMTNTMRREGSARGPAEGTITMRARHLGACPAEMKAGDTRMTGMPGMPAGMPPMPSGGGRMTSEQMQQMIEQMKRGTGSR